MHMENIVEMCNSACCEKLIFFVAVLASHHCFFFCRPQVEKKHKIFQVHSVLLHVHRLLFSRF
jgi:hypothetical protein